jgi:hypothetical protein
MRKEKKRSGMRRFMIGAVLTAVGLLAGSSAFAAGDWALTVDTPLSYTFNSGNATTGASGGAPATWHSRTATNVSGSKVLLIAPFHVGVGYEDYSFAQKADFTQGGGGTGIAQLNTNVRIYDVVVDIPMKHLNLTLGYGTGTADTDLTIVNGGGGGNSPAPIRNANVSQYFLVAGIPLGKSLDLHLGYHWVTIAEEDLTNTGNNGGPNDQTKLSGQMLSAGLRFNF